jgi:hypothetical protein
LSARLVAGVAALVAIIAGPAQAAPRRMAYFTLAIGNNTAAGSPGGLEPLKFADDDAAAVYELSRELGHTSLLLAALDPDTRRRMPELVTLARPPTLAELARAIDELNEEMVAAEAGGAETVLLLFFSGHGIGSDSGNAGLALADGSLTHDRLYDEVLGKLRARTIHLIVDACHAEAVVRPRDLRAQSIPTPPEDLARYVQEHTLARFPTVGAVIASSSAEQAQEWDAYRSGVFTHEVLSALRGAADIDGDRRIEYSELAAFLAAANRSVLDPRARPTTLVRAPDRYPHAAIVSLTSSDLTGGLVGRPSSIGALYIEDARGNRLASVNAERGHRIELLLPAGVDLFVRARQVEAATVLVPRVSRRFEDLVFKPQQARGRGAVEQSLRQGAFVTRFGPSYYSGFMDRRDDLVAVSVPEDLLADSTSWTPVGPTHRGAYLAWGVSAPLAAATGLFGGMALKARRDVQSAPFERNASLAQGRYESYAALAIGSAVGAAIGAAVGYWLWRH